MKDISNKIKQIAHFLESFDNAWYSNNLPLPIKDKIKIRLKRIKESVNSQNYIIDSLFDVYDAGVIHSADLLEYFFSSRLPFLIEQFLGEDTKKLSDFYNVWFNFINYLLVTNIFAPNNNVDLIDLGTGKYKDKQWIIRKVITKEIILKLSKIISPNQFFSLKLLDGLPLTELKKIGYKIGMTENELKKRKNEIIKKMYEKMKEESNKSRVIQWLEHESINSIVLEKLTKNFMKDKTPAFLIKNIGLAEELYVFSALCKEDMGYVIPLLLHQRLFTRIKDALMNKNVKFIDKYICFPTDFLLLKHGRTIAVELGRGKPDLISTFAAVSGLPTVYINTVMKNTNFKIERDFGYKCNLCMLSYIICDKFIEIFSKGKEIVEMKPQDLTCIKLCGQTKAKICEDSVIRTKIQNKNYEVHYQCFLEHYPDKAKHIEIKNLFPLFPEVKGLKEIKLGF